MILARMEADPVPNRHAALHGIIVYRSFKNSLNAIFMTDYIFQVVDAVKKNLQDQQNEIERARFSGGAQFRTGGGPFARQADFLALRTFPRL